MKYISTRGQAPSLNFEEVVLTGLAPDGGLYVPAELPKFDRQQIASWSGLSYEQLAVEVMRPFVAGSLTDDELTGLVSKSYQQFNHQAVAPLVQLESNLWILELFHGPTLAFKDFALQFLGNLLDHFLTKRQQKVVIMGATSGDTGSAAIEGCYRSSFVELFILHPHQRVSEVQRRQMTTVLADNVHNIALDGNFDDCQRMVKSCFSDQNFLPEGRQLVAVNSINWARIMAQIVYYFYAALRLGSPAKVVSFAVPTGNFGDIYAGYLAKSMGLPVEQLVIATNANDILHRCISDNDYSLQALKKSWSPSMDIMVSSNFERLLFDLYQRDGRAVADLMAKLEQGTMRLDPQALNEARQIFSSCRLDDDMTLAEIVQCAKNNGYQLDPHSAIGLASGRLAQSNKAIPMVCLATAHPAKFPEALLAAGFDQAPELPMHLSDLMDRSERWEQLPNDRQAIQNYMQEKLI